MERPPPFGRLRIGAHGVEGQLHWHIEPNSVIPPSLRCAGEPHSPVQCVEWGICVYNLYSLRAAGIGDIAGNLDGELLAIRAEREGLRLLVRAHLDDENQPANLSGAEVDRAHEADAFGRDAEFLRDKRFHIAVVHQPHDDLAALVLVLVGDEEERLENGRHGTAEIEREPAEERRVVHIGVQIDFGFFQFLFDQLIDRDDRWFGRLRGGGLFTWRRFIADRVRVRGDEAEAQPAREGRDGQGSHRDRFQFR